MRSVLCDLAVETEAATATWVRLARAFDALHGADTTIVGGDRDSESAFARLAVAVGKYWVCKRAPGVAYEAMECFGGNGYVEEGPMPRLFRQSPLNAIWEGSGNVICLDVLRALQREPASFDVFLGEIAAAQGQEPRLQALVNEFHSDLRGCANDSELLQRHARRLVDKMAVMLQASVLLQYGHPDVAAAFCASRLPSTVGVAGGGGGGAGMASSLPSSSSSSLGWNYGAMACDVGGAQIEQTLIDRLLVCQSS